MSRPKQQTWSRAACFIRSARYGAPQLPISQKGLQWLLFEPRQEKYSVRRFRTLAAPVSDGDNYSMNMTTVFNYKRAVPKDAILLITVKPPDGKVAEKVFTIVLTEKVLHLETLYPQKRLYPIKTEDGTGSYGRITMDQPVNFHESDCLSVFKPKLPQGLQARVDSGEVEVRIYLDSSLQTELAPDVLNRIKKLGAKR